MTDQEKRKAAIDACARHVVAESVAHGIEYDTGHTAFPTLWSDDADAINARAKQIAESLRPSADGLAAACEHLNADTQDGAA